MSAIWGAINLAKQPISETVKEKMKAGFKDCKLDRVEELVTDNTYFACGIQYFTPEAKNEVLPVETNSNIFTADVILDNREELIANLLKQKNIIEPNDVPDGRLLQDYYNAFGKKSFNDLLGAYVFVNYNKEENTVEVLCDAVGNRYIYYYIEENIFYFSSLMKPIQAIMSKVEINDRWVADYLAQNNLGMFTEPRENIIKGIIKTPSATFTKINMSGVHEETYWDSSNHKKTRFKNDKEYKKAFLALYKECVECVLRSPAETSILLSGGYDSTSVAVMAAPILKERGKKLYSYTSIPIDEHNSVNNRFLIENETELVNATVNMYPNIEPEFVKFPELNGWDDYKWYINIAEQPYKSVQNIIWIYKCNQLASNKNCKIMLVGDMGNGTVSFDNITNYLKWLWRNHRYIKVLHEINCFHKRTNFSRKQWLSFIAQNAKFNYPENDKNKIHFWEEGYVKKDTDNSEYWLDYFLQNSFVKKDFVKNYGNLKALVDFTILEAEYAEDIDHTIDLFSSQLRMRYYTEISQKSSLYTGIIERDPTKDKRLIEFVSGLPYNQFTKNGETRRLVYTYMNELMPKEIIHTLKKGRQSADVVTRWSLQKDYFISEFEQYIAEYSNNKYIDTNIINTLLKNNTSDELDQWELIRIMYSLQLLKYTNDIK